MIYINSTTDTLVLPQNGFSTVKTVYKYKIYRAGRPVTEVMSGYIIADEVTPNMITWKPDEETMAAVKGMDTEREYCICVYDRDNGLPVSMTFFRVSTDAATDINNNDVIDDDVIIERV